MGMEKRSAPLWDSSSSEMYNKKEWTVIYKRCMHEQRRDSRLSHVPFSRLFVAGAPAVSKDYAAQCIRFLAYVRDATMYYIQRDAAAAAMVTAGTTGAATSLRRMCAAWWLQCTQRLRSSRAQELVKRNGLPVMLTPSNCDRRHRMIKSVSREAEREKIRNYWRYMSIVSLPILLHNQKFDNSIRTLKT